MDKITDGEGHHVKELVLSSKTIEILFDKTVYNLAFEFTLEQFNRYGALVEGIVNTYLCCRKKGS
jgi:hypothetical protein